MITPPKELIEKFKAVNGAMSVAEGIALHNVALQAPAGTWVELGSHKGKSSTMIAAAMKDGVQLNLVEPEFKDNEWAASVAESIMPCNILNVQFWPTYSTEVLPLLGEVHFLFVDSGDHGEEIVQSELPLYEDKIVSGGIIAYHDFGSQFTAVARAYHYLISTGKYEPIQIDWNEIFEVADETGNLSWHQYPELPHSPNFIGALRKK